MLLSTLVGLLAGCPDIPTEDPGVGDSADTADTAAPDQDEDGFGDDVDCDDTDASVNPGVAADGCNGVDDDCDGDLDEDPDLTWYPDADGDGYGGAGESTVSCVVPAGYAAGTSDCDDTAAETWPGADERCDEADNDCDGLVDDGLVADVPYWIDTDGDGAGDPDSVAFACARPSGDDVVGNGLDCDDTDPGSPVWVEHGAGSGSGTHDDPYHKVQDALKSGAQCALVGPGNYPEDLTWPDTDIWVRSTDGAGSTTITGSGTAPVVTVADGSSTLSTLEGFTITGGGGRQITSTGSVGGINYYYTKYFGGGVAVGSRSGLALRSCVVENNVLEEYAESTSGSSRYVTASYGGGVYVQGGSLVLDDVELRDNYAYNGGAAYVTGGVLTTFNTWIGGNKAYAWASLYADLGSELSMSATIVDANQPTSSPGGLSVYDSTLTLDHVDVVSHDYGVLARNSVIDMTSSIFAGNAYGMQLTSSTLYASYSAFDNDTTNYVGVTDPTGVNGNLAVDCLFTLFKDDTNAENDTLTLTAGSPCADVGPPGETDPDGSASDLGAYGGPYGAW